MIELETTKLEGIMSPKNCIVLKIAHTEQGKTSYLHQFFIQTQLFNPAQLTTKKTSVTLINPISHGVFWITHTWLGKILPAPCNIAILKDYGFEIWHASITFYCLFKTVKKFMQISQNDH